MRTTHHSVNIARCLAVICFAACSKLFPDSSQTDPLPLPPEIEANKDLSVKPGDSFFDYCNGGWLSSHPIPATGNIGGLYEADVAMAQRVDQLKASSPDIGHFFDLMDHMHDQPEKSRAYVDALKARFPKPATKEEAFLTMGKMLAEGIISWDLVWTGEKLMGLINPLEENPEKSSYINPENYLPLSQTKSGDINSAYTLVVKGMGLDPAQFVTDETTEPLWEQFQGMSLEDLCSRLDNAWDNYDIDKEGALDDARCSLSYTLSYQLAEQFISPALKEKCENITREIQASLRKRIQQVDWMSETTKNNAVDKLDHCHLFVIYPDEWHTDCVSPLTDCETLVEAVLRNNRDLSRLRCKLLGGTDLFSNMIIQNLETSDNTLIPADLSVANAFYDPECNSIFIYPALFMPPMWPDNVSDAFSYSVFTVIGHEFTHGFDTNGARYDKFGNLHNWWTVADQMAFEDRRKNIIQCYSHMELDPQRAPGVYGDGDRTQTENIADLGGFLTTLDAYKAKLEKEGYFGKVYDNQIRKFYECFAHFWCIQYGPEKFSILQKTDVHSHARLRINGVVMNTDLWYDLYDVDRNNHLYLPQERRAYIW